MFLCFLTVKDVYIRLEDIANGEDSGVHGGEAD